jgi:hypothetical protein
MNQNLKVESNDLISKIWDENTPLIELALEVSAVMHETDCWKSACSILCDGNETLMDEAFSKGRQALSADSVSSELPK